MTLLNDLPRMAVEWLLWRLPCEQKPPILSTSQTPIFWTPGSCCNSCAASSVFNLAMIYDMQLGGWQRGHQKWQRLTVKPRTPKRQSKTMYICIYIYIYLNKSTIVGVQCCYCIRMCAFNILYIYIYTWMIIIIYDIHVLVSVFLGMKENNGKHTYLNIDVFVRKVPQRVWWKQFYEALKTHDMSCTCWQTRTFVL